MTPAPACRVEELRLYCFRNYADETVALGPGLNVVSGPNAQGKTNLLEAIATAALTRSPRASSSAELLLWGADAAQVTARVRRPDGPTTLELRLQRSGGQDTLVRTLRVDGSPRPARAVLGVCPVVLFWPEDLLLVKGAPEGRRRLVDVVVAQTDARAAAEMVRYRRVLDQRNALLRQVRLGQASPAPLPGFTQELARAAGIVLIARLRLVEALAPLAAAALREISDGREEVGLRYRAEGLEGPLPTTPEEAAARLVVALDGRHAEELARGVTVAGPHRDDVDILLDERPARAAASQGQQRSLVLACKLAEVRHLTALLGMAPVLLLDDVLSELDARRREHLLAALGAGTHLQTVLTTTDPRGRRGRIGSMSLLIRRGGVSAGGSAAAARGGTPPLSR
ncbi:MAG: DNA replication/repair protein RecF [Chloroflexi bacterium]|nr:MAG: DNA replication/repair protein RecF [Chloroflexota bacterium]